MTTVQFEFDFETFVNNYLNAAAWTTLDDYTECGEFTKEAKERAKKDCLNFVLLIYNNFSFVEATHLLTVCNYNAAIDFWLTRNHHGSGFWDKPGTYGFEEADKLTQLAQQMKECDCLHIGGKKSKLTFLC